MHYISHIIGKKRLKVLFALLSFITYYLMQASYVKASDFSLGVYPPIMQIQATGPTVFTKDITLVNASDNEITVAPVFKLFTQANGDSGHVQYLPVGTLPTPDHDIFHRIQLLDNGIPITEVTLAPKQKHTLSMRVGLPKGEPGGDYYFSIIFVSKQNADTSQNNTHITAGIAVNVLLSIGPKDVTTGLLSEFSSPFFVQTGPIPFTVSISNTSRHFISPTGHILVRNMFGQLIGQIDLRSDNVLGQTNRYLVSSKNPGAMTNGHPAVLWPEKVLFGIYRANIVVSLSDQGPIFSRSLYFFAMPWEYIVGFILVIIIATSIFVRVLQRVRNQN